MRIPSNNPNFSVIITRIELKKGHTYINITVAAARASRALGRKSAKLEETQGDKEKEEVKREAETSATLSADVDATTTATPKTGTITMAPASAEVTNMEEGDVSLEEEENMNAKTTTAEARAVRGPPLPPVPLSQERRPREV